MKDRCLNHLRDIGAILGGTTVLAAAGGKAHLVIDHDVHRAAGTVGPGLGHLEGFHHHALTRKGRVAMEENRDHGPPRDIAAAILARARRAFHHRRDNFQMRGIEVERKVNRATGRHHVGGKSLVIFHVPRGVQNLFALELLEQLRRIFAQHIDQYIEPTAMGHAQNDFLGAVFAGPIDEAIQCGDQRFAAFETEALGTRILGIKVLFEPLRGREAAQNAHPQIGVVARMGTLGLEALLEPLLLFQRGDVHELRTQMAAVRRFESLDDFPQRGLVLADIERTGLESGVEIGGGQAVKGQLKVGNLFPLHQPQRVQFGFLVTALPIGADQL